MSLCGLVFVSTVTDLHRQQQSELGPDRRPPCLGLPPQLEFLLQVFNMKPFLWYWCVFLWIYREDTCFFLNRYNDSYSQCNQGSAPDDHGDEIRSRSIQIVWISAGLFHKPKQFSKWLAIKKNYIESTNIFLGSLDYFSYDADTANTFGDRYATIQTHVWRSYVSYVLMFTLFKFLSQAHTMKLQVWYLPGWGISCRSCDTINGAFDNSGRRRGEFYAAADTFLADIFTS